MTSHISRHLNPTKFRAYVCAFLTVLLSMVPGMVSGAGLVQGPAKISKIEIEGLQRLTSADVIATSGLKIGQAYDDAAVDAAAARLADSGLFKKVSVRARTNAGQATIIFIVEESKAEYSVVVFDNFIWFSDQELIEAVQKTVPSFTGAAPNAGEMINSITAALQKLLRNRNLEGTVESMPSQTEHVLTVTGIKLPICTLHFPGAKNVSEAKLISSSKEITGTDYSRKVAAGFAVYGLFPIYRELGQLQATFGQPSARPEESATCKGGVDLTIPVAEGPIYSWAKVEWTGNQVLASQDLDAALGMKTGEVANGLKFDKGMQEIRKAYGRKGYLDVRSKSEPEFDDSGPRVTYKIDIREGPQYRMGTVTVKGFPASAEKLLRQKWELQTGGVFDEGYLDDFLKKGLREVAKVMAEEYSSQGKSMPKKMGGSYEPNSQTLTVNVTFEASN